MLEHIKELMTLNQQGEVSALLDAAEYKNTVAALLSNAAINHAPTYDEISLNCMVKGTH